MDKQEVIAKIEEALEKIAFFEGTKEAALSMLLPLVAEFSDGEDMQNHEKPEQWAQVIRRLIEWRQGDYHVSYEIRRYTKSGVLANRVETIGGYFRNMKGWGKAHGQRPEIQEPKPVKAVAKTEKRRRRLKIPQSAHPNP